MFEKRKAAQAEKQYQAAVAAWQHEHDELTAVLAAATTRQGSDAGSLMLKANEAVFAKVTGVGLVEMRRGAGHWEGRSQGVSIPIGSLGGRSVRYRVGASKGHYVQGDAHPQAVDRGELYVTNQRLVFIGSSKTVECQFPKLVGINQGPGDLTISVSNRQKATVIHYGTKLDGWMRLRLDLALAIFRGESDKFAATVAEQLRELEHARPTAPALPS